MDDEQTRAALIEYAQANESAAFKLKHALASISLAVNSGNDIDETAFTSLSFEKRTSTHLGDFEVAEKSANIEPVWTRAFDVLTKNNATISSRYSGKGYACGYWLFGQKNERIYRQKLNQGSNSQGE